MHAARQQGWEAYVKIEADLDERLRKSQGRGVKGRAAQRDDARRQQVRRRRLTAALLVLGLALIGALLFVLSGCGYGDQVTDAGPVTTLEPAADDTQDQADTSATERTTTTETTQETEPGQDPTLEVNVYFPRADKIGAASRQVPYTQQTGEAAMEELLEGPTQFEAEAANMSTAIPEGTTLLGVNIDPDRTATVDLSKEFASGGGTLSMTMRLAEVVYTLTQFPTVDAVSFMLDGEPVTVFGPEGILLEEPVGRDYFEEVSPAILVENPAVGEVVSPPTLSLAGTANVFEATFQVNLTNWDGLILEAATVTATSGSGTRGAFDTTLDFSVQQPEAKMLGSVIVFTESAKDGSQENVVEVPIYIQK